MVSEAAVPALRIDLGCGSARRDGFVGLDVFPGPEVDHVIDLTADPFPFADDSVDEVFSAHFLEHIDSPNHVFGEIGRVCRDGARIEFWTPYAFTNEAFLYGHLHGITEEMWIHLGLTHRDIYAPMLNGRWLLQRFVFVIEPATIADLEHHRVDLDFAVRYLKGVVHEFGVELEYQSDLEAPPRVPERAYATTRFGSRRPLTTPTGAVSGRLRREAKRAVAQARRLGRRVVDSARGR
jgi:SAM-dependent methyltransferase